MSPFDSPSDIPGIINPALEPLLEGASTSEPGSIEFERERPAPLMPDQAGRPPATGNPEGSQKDFKEEDENIGSADIERLKHHEELRADLDDEPESDESDIEKAG